MTLVVAWRDITGAVHLASDSRISFKQSLPVDAAVKIAEVPMHLYGPTPAGGTDVSLHETTLGLATVGSVITTHMVKEAVRQALVSAQVLCTEKPTSLETVAGVVRRLLEQIAQSASYSLAEGGVGALILVGWCPATGRGRAFLIDCPRPATERPTATEIVQNKSEVTFLGSGAPAAEGVLPSGKCVYGTEPFDALRTVIHDAQEQSVGGAIQCGSLDPHSFRIFGVRDYRIDDAGEVSTHFSLSGIELPTPKIGDGDVFVKLRAKDPFRKQINALLGASPEQE